ncbi:MAG: sulfatase-like hydrolase/transferase [Bilifractor sp.]|jgi:phosphoglycerol transferase MdoB-like AlkP superfamily enzyme
MKKKQTDNKTRERRIQFMNRFAVPLSAAASILLNFAIEWMSRHSFYAAFQYMTGKPLVFLFNALIIFMCSTVAFLFRRRYFIRVLVFALWFALGMTNGIVLMNRVTPFTGPDFRLIKDAFRVIGKYIPAPFVVLILIGIGLAIFALVRLFFVGPKYQGKRNLVLDIVLVAGTVAAFFGCRQLALNARIISNYFGNIAFAYEDYGFPYCLGVTVFDTGISQPNGYSEELVDDIVASEGDEEDTATGNVNIIFLQLESFMDPSLVNFLDISEDPIPYFHSLEKEYSSGYFRVPVVGAGTANTEFETITGMSLRYFGAGEYPYKTLLKKETCESIPYIMKSLGYKTHAIHNNEASFYSRNKVFPMLGFDTFTSEEYMEKTDDRTETGWMKDAALTSEVMKTLNSTSEPDYIYTISVQGHGSYPTEEGEEELQFQVTGAEGREQNNESWEYYCQQIHEMDEFIQELTEELSDFDEPVVLVMYGDHLPTMGLETEDLKDRYLFQTEYVIWDNFGLEEKDQDIASYQIGAEVLDRLGIHDGTLVRYHQTRRNTKNYQADLEVLQYDMLYGNRYVYQGKKDLFQPTDMQMGVVPITVDSIRKEGDGYIIRGSNFTDHSVVEINEKTEGETVFLSSEELFLTGVTIEPDDMVDVGQQSASTKKSILTRTEAKTLSYYLSQGELSGSGGTDASAQAAGGTGDTASEAAGEGQ